MAKFYVQSGTVRAIIDAESQDRAALWVVHRAMQQIMPIYDDVELTAQQKCDNAMVEGMLVLDARIKLSEIGFDRPDCLSLETFEVVAEWHRLMVALERLQRMLDSQ
jgi:hypothetical protein